MKRCREDTDSLLLAPLTFSERAWMMPSPRYKELLAPAQGLQNLTAPNIVTRFQDSFNDADLSAGFMVLTRSFAAFLPSSLDGDALLLCELFRAVKMACFC